MESDQDFKYVGPEGGWTAAGMIAERAREVAEELRKGGPGSLALADELLKEIAEEAQQARVRLNQWRGQLERGGIYEPG